MYKIKASVKFYFETNIIGNIYICIHSSLWSNVYIMNLIRWPIYLTNLSQSDCIVTWWRHQMETFSALLAICAGNSPVSGEFSAQRPVTRSFDVFFDLCPNKQLSKQMVRLVIWDAIVCLSFFVYHYSDVIMSTMASRITGVSIVCSAVCSGADQRKPQSSASLAFVKEIHG